jgi:succinate dehydrogenase/fumarate reductase flavoprotein subunit
VQATAQQPAARAWYLLDDHALADPDIAARVALASTRTEPSELPFPAPSGTRVGVRVKPGITHTIGGLRIDEHARVTDGLYAAGADVGGISTGGYASGLAAALVFGRIAAESALGGL